MGIFDKFKKVNKEETKKPSSSGAVVKDEKIKKEEKKVVEPKAKAEVSALKETKKLEPKTGELKGKTTLAYRVLVKPLITEKASDLGPLNKYIFAINPKMNKVEVKKAIRTIYNVEPIKVNISNLSGKNVRYGRIQGKTKSWKKAIVTLKAGDKIEVYEGV
ncbi:MAG: 50S ribosomal protein L23 [Patescibacteria group bacterium]|jgi:large subunit ribosomal protein L23